MSRIDKLIADLCPDGVEFKRIADVSSKGSKIKWAQVGNAEYQYIDLGAVEPRTRQIGKTQAINSCNAPSRAQQIVHSGDIIFATTRPTQLRWAVIPDSYDGQVVSTGYCVIRPDRFSIITNYLAHTLGTTSFLKYLKANQILGNYPSIPDSRIQEFRIPVPPFEVQREIARVLDKFTQLEAELEAELEARHHQYKYYQKTLLTPADKSYHTASLGELFELRAGKFISATLITPERDAEHPIPCFGGGGLRGYVSSHNQNGDLVLIGRQGALCGNVKRASGKFYATEHAVVVSPKSAVDIRWAFHLLSHMNLNQYASKSAQPGLSVNMLKQLSVPVPPLPVQVATASILDKFDSLVNDLSIGLPAELAARRKQYEYYRDRLLTFEEKR